MTNREKEVHQYRRESPDREGDSGAITLYKSACNVDQVLRLPPAGNNHGCILEINVKDWCNSLAKMFSGDHCLMTDLGGNRVYGLFHQMREGEHDAFEAHLSRFAMWAAQCDAGNITTGNCTQWF